MRKPFQGIVNIIRFNWHFYILACLLLALLVSSTYVLPNRLYWPTLAIAFSIFITTFSSLAVSYYVYDYAGLYNFTWLGYLACTAETKILNINAGFDETSEIFKRKYPTSNFQALDFYNKQKHTEVSIERARKAYPAYPGTKQISTDYIPVEGGSVDFIFNIFSLHEIRDKDERINFIKNQFTVLKDNGCCIIMEHPRDLANFIAYTIGFFHFFPKGEWLSNFLVAGFQVEKLIKMTPFVSIFILKKINGNTP